MVRRTPTIGTDVDPAIEVYSTILNLLADPSVTIDPEDREVLAEAAAIAEDLRVDALD